MAAKPKKRKQHTIAGRIMLYMVLLGILMIVATCAAAGYRVFRDRMELYQDYAYSFAKTIATNIPPEDIEHYTEMEKRFSSENDGGKALQEFRENTFSDDEYSRIDLLLISTAAFSDLRHVYVVVPEENELVYLWYMFHINLGEPSLSEQEEKDMETNIPPFQHVPYEKDQKEVIMSVLDGTWDGSLFLNGDLNNKEALGTAYFPIGDEDKGILAIVGVDLDIYDMVVTIVRVCLNIFLSISIILTVCMIIVYYLIRLRVIKPVVVLKKATTDLVENLDSGKGFEVPIHSGDEIEVLARSFEEMDVRLKQYLQENTVIIAERERLSTELDLARSIQAGMLPSSFPAFPDRKEFDIYASMTPAKEVGGDFYDFFLVDEDHLALTIADVSGKGIPAALVMMMSMIMLRNYVMDGLGPKDVLEKVNNQIYGNKEEMFVTVWLGILDIKSGVIVAANAGHEYPMHKNGGSVFRLVRDPHGLVLGAMKGASFEEYDMKLERGSTLFVYTDGVPEATGGQDEMFGTDRTLDALNEEAQATPKELVEAVDSHVKLFVGDEPQFDDLTMLCISYFGSDGE